MVLEEIWNGKIVPQERTATFDKDLERKRKALQEEYNLIKDELSANGKSRLEKYDHLLMEIQSIFEEKIFIEAFRLASKIMIEVFKE